MDTMKHFIPFIDKDEDEDDASDAKGPHANISGGQQSPHDNKAATSVIRAASDDTSTCTDAMSSRSNGIGCNSSGGSHRQPMGRMHHDSIARMAVQGTAATAVWITCCPFFLCICFLTQNCNLQHCK